LHLPDPAINEGGGIIIRMQQIEAADGDARPKWFNSPVSFHEGTLTEVRRYIPTFERRGFGLTQYGNEQSHLNERLDMIVRLPFGTDLTFIPVGVVSKDYALVQHNAVLDIATAALNGVKIAPGDVRAELTITEYGERMALSLYLPEKVPLRPEVLADR